MTTPTPPRRRIEPLPPPPGQFDAVLNRARARRYHRLSAVAGVATVFVAGIAGGLAMGGQVSDVPNSLYSLATGGDEKVATSPPAQDTTSAAVAPSKSDKPVKSQTSSPPTSTAVKTVAQGRPVVRGRVVDTAGQPVAGLFVYTGTTPNDAFVPTTASPSAITGVGGGYRVPCTGGPVLLTSWELNTPQGLYADGRWAATLVTKAKCGVKEPRKVTEITPGASVFGHVHTAPSCADADFPMWLWLNGHRTTAVRLSHLRDGDGFLVSGLPAGTHVLSVRDSQTPVTVGKSGQVDQEIDVPCPDAPPEIEPPPDSPSPEVSPEPTDTPTETESPDPGSPTATP